MVTFKYDGKIITTPNLEKKLKRMKLQLSDIEIIEEEIKKKENDSGVEDYMLNKIKVVIRHPNDNIRRICYVDKSLVNDRPTSEKPVLSPKELLISQRWNPDTRTGIRSYTESFLNEMYYEHR